MKMLRIHRYAAYLLCTGIIRNAADAYRIANKFVNCHI